MYADFRVGLPVALACTWYGSPFGDIGLFLSVIGLFLASILLLLEFACMLIGI